jgi:opacity protein-like surface antigen
MGDFRIEEELAGHGFAIDGRNGQNASTGKKGYLGTSALMTNIYYDIHTGSRFTPFVGAGIGIAKSHFSKNPGYGITDKTSSGASFAYQFKAGVSYMPEGWNNFSFNLAYVYFNGGSPKFDASGGKEKIDDFSSNGIELGVSYAF